MPYSAKVLSTDILLQLMSILEEMVQLHQRLLSILQKEKRLIIEGDHEALVLCLGKKEVVLSCLSQLESNRQEIMAKIEGQIGEKQPEMTLKEILPLVPETHRNRLLDVHRQLDILTTSIHEINQINGILTERVLQQISGLVGLLKHLIPNGLTYQQTGMIHDVLSAGRMIGKV